MQISPGIKFELNNRDGAHRPDFYIKSKRERDWDRRERECVCVCERIFWSAGSSLKNNHRPIFDYNFLWCKTRFHWITIFKYELAISFNGEIQFSAMKTSQTLIVNWFLIQYMPTTFCKSVLKHLRPIYKCNLSYYLRFYSI